MVAKIRVTVDEEAEVVAVIDRLAAAEGLVRSDIVRRALRYLTAPYMPNRGFVHQPVQQPRGRPRANKGAK